MTAKPKPPPEFEDGCPRCGADPPPNLYAPYCSREHWLLRPSGWLRAGPSDGPRPGWHEAGG